MTVPADEVKPTPVNHDGGIVAFATTPSPGATVPQEMEKTSRPDNDVSHETTFTQEMVAVAEALENLPDDMSSLPSHMIQVIHHGEPVAINIRVDAKATIGSITVAETAMHVLSQPVRVNTCLGTPLKVGDTTMPLQQIFLREMSTYGCDPKAELAMPCVLRSSEVQTRLQILYQQEAWVANDKMTHYLKMVSAASSAKVSPLGIVPEASMDDELEDLLQDWMKQCIPDDQSSGKNINHSTFCC